MTKQDAVVFRINDVCKKTGLSKSTIRYKTKNGEFPQMIKLGVRARGWLSGDIDGWLENCQKAG